MRRLVFLALMALGACAAAAPLNALSVDYQANGTVINLCTSSYTPMVDCEIDVDPSLWSGYEVLLFKRVLERFNWPETAMKWHCLDWEDMKNGLLVGSDKVDTPAAEDAKGEQPKRAPVRCDVAAAGMPITLDDVNSGIVFSWPTYKNGLVVAVSPQIKSSSYFAFTNAFEWTLWAAIVITGVLVGFIAFGIDAYMRGVRRRGTKIEVGAPDAPANERKTMDVYVWESLGRPMQTRDHVGLAFPTNIVVLIYAFMMLVLVTLYTANTTANITTTRLQSTITGVQDLPGKRVGTWTEYQPQLRKYGIVAEGFVWETADDEAAMVDALTSGAIQALVLEGSFLVYRASSSCDLAVVGATFEEFDQAIALSPSFSAANPRLLDSINAALVALKEDGILEQLKNQQVDPPDNQCKTSALAAEGSTKVTFSQVAGLWIMLAGGVAIAVVLAVAYKLHEKYTQRHVRQLGSQMKRQLTKVVSRRFSGSSKKRGGGAGEKSARRGHLDTSGLDIASVTTSEAGESTHGGKNLLTPSSTDDPKSANNV